MRLGYLLYFFVPFLSLTGPTGPTTFFSFYLSPLTFLNTARGVLIRRGQTSSAPERREVAMARRPDSTAGGRWACAARRSDAEEETRAGKTEGRRAGHRVAGAPRWSNRRRSLRERRAAVEARELPRGRQQARASARTRAQSSREMHACSCGMPEQQAHSRSGAGLRATGRLRRAGTPASF
jgi:hypothetical protein